MPASPHSIRVALDEPSIYLEIEVESSKTLCDLAEAIVHASGFDFDHAFGFYSSVMRSQPKYELVADMGEGTSAKSVKKSRVIDAFPPWASHAVPRRLWR